MDEGTIKIDGGVYEVDDIRVFCYLPLITCGKLEFYVAESSEHAGEKAKEHYEDMIQQDPEEFKCIVGVDALVAWALGQNYAPGNVGVSSLQEWLDLVAEHPEEEWGRWDGTELEVEDVAEDVAERLGFTPTVAYRT